MSAEKWTASWPQAWKASSPTSRSDSCTLGVTSEGRASRVFHVRPRDFRKFTLTAYRFYLMVRSFERRDRDASTRVPLAPGGGESTAWLGFASRRTSPSRARSAASRSSVRRPASWPSCASASITRSRACDGRRRQWPRASAPSVARPVPRSEEHTSELQSLAYIVCRLLLEKKKIDVQTCS